MGKWITTNGATIQSLIPNKVVTLSNQLYFEDGNLYLAPRGLVTDNYSIPLNIDKSKYDARPSHIHDIGCYYHQIIKVNLPLEVVYEKYLLFNKCKVKCKDIPIEYLEIVDVSFNEINSLFGRMLSAINSIPKFTSKLYRFAVNFNVNWLFTGKVKIDLDNIYTNLYTFKCK